MPCLFFAQGQQDNRGGWGKGSVPKLLRACLKWQCLHLPPGVCLESKLNPMAFHLESKHQEISFIHSIPWNVPHRHSLWAVEGKGLFQLEPGG